VIGYARTVPDETPIEPAPPRYRPTSRVLVVDARGRLLLLLIEDAKARDARFWITPGGGLDPGESFEAGAARELWEETGIVAPLGPCVWRRRRLVMYDGRTYDFDERFFVVRVDSATVSSEHVTDWERRVLTGYRWWSLEELMATDEVLAPLSLAELIAPILAGADPPEPLVLQSS
jgi:8-oxo-dGTP pyrophosphatase MutT (NUDIX family)